MGAYARRGQALRESVADRAVAGTRVEESTIEMRTFRPREKELGEHIAQAQARKPARRDLGRELIARQAPEFLGIVEQQRPAEAQTVAVGDQIGEGPLRTRQQPPPEERGGCPGAFDDAAVAQPVDRAGRKVEEAAAVKDLARGVDLDQLVAQERAQVAGDLGVAIVEAVGARVVSVRAAGVGTAEPTELAGALEEAKGEARPGGVVGHRQAGGPAPQNVDGRLFTVPMRAHPWAGT